MATEPMVAARRITSVNPATGENLSGFSCTEEAEVQAAVARARQAQEAWNQIGVADRIKTIRRFQRLLHARKSDVARLITREAGKPYV